ncbi:MAG: hypothetical protein WC916_06100 [Candidatus Woesearchaeota archaeon]
MLQKMTLIKRVYAKDDVSDMTLDEVEALIEKTGITYAADYGFKVQDSVDLVHSEN